MKTILGVSLLILLMSSAYAAELPGDSAEGKRLHLHGVPRHWHLHLQGPTHSVFGCAEKAIRHLQSYGKQRILRDRNAEHHQEPERSVL